MAPARHGDRVDGWGRRLKWTVTVFSCSLGVRTEVRLYGGGSLAGVLRHAESNGGSPGRSADQADKATTSRDGSAARGAAARSRARRNAPVARLPWSARVRSTMSNAGAHASGTNRTPGVA